MLPMYMMREVVAYQMNDLEAPLPPVDLMIADVEECLAKQEEQLARIDNAVTKVLQERSEESILALEDILASIIQDDPNGAVRPQIENIQRAVVDIKGIQQGMFKAVVQSNDELQQKTRQYIALQNSLARLQDTLKKGNGDPIRGFLKECAGKGASYVANH